MRTTVVISLSFLFFVSMPVFGQADSLIATIKQVPARYLHQVEEKVTRYANRISSKTEKTLTKLARWEAKIKSALDAVNPEASQKLFSNPNLTFAGLLRKVKEGEEIVAGYRSQYNEYRDKLTTSIKYLEQQQELLNKKVIQPIKDTKRKLTELEQEVANAESIEAFIRERKKQLLDEAVNYIGKSKYLTKIDKEAYYYVETLKNYKELFTDKKKAEQLAYKVLNRIPAFQKFLQQNSLFASLFRRPGSGGGGLSAQDMAGLQTREGVNSLIQERLAAGGPNAQQAFSQNMQAAQADLNSWKNRILKGGGSSSETEIPNFKPNTQKSKTFLQRLEYGANLQFGKSNSLVPSSADIALSVGYKLNDKSIAGIGISYKLGYGSLRRLSISHQGLGIRSFIDWKLKKQFFISGGFEMNYNAQFKNIHELKNRGAWQQAGLIGLTRKLSIRTKFFKATSVQVLYDFLYREHVPVSQPFLFRMGYSFK